MVIYFISSNFIFDFINFCVIVSFFLLKLLILGNLFLTAVRAVVVVAKLVILVILFLISFILALIAVIVAKLVVLSISYLTSFTLVLRVVLVAKLVISGIFSSILLAMHASCLTTSFFTTSLILLRSTGAGINLTKCNLSTLFFKLLKLVGTFFNLSVSNLSASYLN